MKKLKIYLDTSVISHLFAEDTPDKMADTNNLWGNFISGKYDIFISTSTVEEIQKCSEPKRGKMVEKLDEIDFQILRETSEINELAVEYVNNGVLSQKSIEDCLHIAFAVVANCDIHFVEFQTFSRP
ncbi:MAG: PIN domain-containing protein [Candidatus Bathyarchaeota archaeon]|nr:PIN domain-containing protein [Candidatus Termitimicrobium sp.]